jgi:uncharacterized protein (UPF0305 family)
MLCLPKQMKNTYVSAWIKQCMNSVAEMRYKNNGSESKQQETPSHGATHEKSEILKDTWDCISTDTLI